MALHDVVSYHRMVQFDLMADEPSDFVTLSVNFGTQLRPKIEEKWFRGYDRDNILLAAKGGGKIIGQWCYSRSPHHTHHVDPWNLWQYVVKKVPEDQLLLALKIKVHEDRLDYRGYPRWELVYVKPSKRVAQPSLSTQALLQNSSTSASRSTLARCGSIDKKMPRRSSSDKSASPAPSRSASIADIPQYQNIDKKVPRRRSSTMSTSQISRRSASVSSLPPPYDSTQVWPSARKVVY